MEQHASVFIIDNPSDSRTLVNWLFQSTNLPTKLFDTGSQFLAACDENTRGCLLMEISLPDMTGLELQQKVKERNPSLSVVFMSSQPTLKTAIHAIKQGAIDFLIKPFNAQILITTIQRALRQSEAQNVQYQLYAPIKQQIASLTRREREVMELVVVGHRSKTIATQLSISLKTAELYRARILEKLHAYSSVHLTNIVLNYRHHSDHGRS